jgi:DNA-binding GntR family transcriptional regulator
MTKQYSEVMSSMNFPLRKPDSLRSYVENYLRDAITSGQFKPGERLRERELCELLDVSRPSVREALRKLEAEKLITTTPHKGPAVASITRDEALDLYAVRALMEGFAVHEFARLVSDDMVEQLGDAVTNLHAAAASGERKQLLAAKATFYDIILNGCGNALVKEYLLAMLSRINLLRSISFSSADRLPLSLQEIDQIYALIKARDAKAAQEAAQQHIFNAQQAALTVLEQQQAPSTLPPKE